MERITIPILIDFVRIRGDNPCKVLNPLPWTDSVYDVWTAPSSIPFPEGYAIKCHLSWVIFLKKLNTYLNCTFSPLNNLNIAEDVFSRLCKGILSEMRSILKNVDSEAEIFSKS